MSANWVTCPNCGAQRNASTDYTSPANAKRDEVAWALEHTSKVCLVVVARRFHTMNWPPVREGVCLICGGAVLNNGEHVDPERHDEEVRVRQLLKRPMITILGLRNDKNEPWQRHATDGDLMQMAVDPKLYEPHDPERDHWGWP